MITQWIIKEVPRCL